MILDTGLNGQSVYDTRLEARGGVPTMHPEEERKA